MFRETKARDHRMESEIQEILEVPEARDYTMESEIQEMFDVSEARDHSMESEIQEILDVQEARDHSMESEIQEIFDVPEARDHSMESEIPETLHVQEPKEEPVCLQEFELYATRSYFYMIGHDRRGAVHRVLKISRLEPSKLNIIEDSTVYSKAACDELLQRIHHGNMSTGGLEFVTVCYGIVGFVKFLGPYYMLLITERREIGVIRGHAIYAITGSKLISVPSSTVAYSKNENRYKKLLCTMNLSNGFYFSYSYHVMHTVQKNMSEHGGQDIYETMYVWNASMTSEIRNQLRNTLWTVALVYGFFKQVKLQISGKDISLTLIARRSRHYAGTRFLKRGVNEEGHVANDVETEQIVIKDVPEGCASTSSVVQHRGSIPLFWSQHTSRFNMKPDIILSKKDPKYQATKLHFENLAERYGLPIIILNLIKTQERRPRESILCEEFKNAINLINSEVSEENNLKFLHWDISKSSRSKTTNVLSILTKMAACALDLTGIFCCQVHPSSRRKETFHCLPSENCGSMQKKECCYLKDVVCRGADDVAGSNLIKQSFQKGILRTNCIDCLDRTNVAQFAYGLVAFGRQLHTLGLQDLPSIDLDTPPANDLLRLYEMMGDAVAFQYGGSAAHNKIFCQRRGQCKAATGSQQIIRTLQRYYSNAYLDAEKQDAINVFLGHFQLHEGKPELWEMNSDQHYNVEKRNFKFSEQNSRSAIKRSLSDGIFLSESKSPVENASVSKHDNIIPEFPDKMQDKIKVHSGSAPEILNCKHQASYCRQLFPNIHPEEELFCYSNFLDIEWHSSSGNSWEEELSTLPRSPEFRLKSDSVTNELKVVANTCQCGCSLQGSGMNTEDLDNDAAHSLNIATDFSSSFARLLERCCSL